MRPPLSSPRWRFRHLLVRQLVLLVLVHGLIPASGRCAEDGSKPGEDSPAYNTLDQLNVGLPRLDAPPDLATPQSALEAFIGSSEAGQYARAAYALNLNAIPPEQQVEQGRALAEKLKAVMDQQVWFQWSDVPDRPDGQVDEPRPQTMSLEKSGPQASILLYRLYIGDHDYEIRLERVKTPGDPPIWVFSRQTVGHVPVLYREFHPGRIESSLPRFLKENRFIKVALWQWVGFAILLLTGCSLGWLVQKAMDLLLRRLDSPWTRATAMAIRGPGALTIGLFVFYELVRKYLGLAGPILSVLEPFYIGIMVASLVWFLQRLIQLITDRVTRRYTGAGSDEANILITRIAFVRHLLVFLVIIGGAAYALSGFEWVRRFGTAIIASAGVAGVLLGIAAQRVLGNFFAGLLLATTQPLKSGDAIIFEQEYGWVEEIGMTYIVLRTWDLRRLIIPLSFLMDRPLQNWSRGSQQIIKPVVVHADYRIDVEAVRAELKTILEQSEQWDRTVPPILQVTECRPETIEIRALCSAQDPAASWDLHCFVRERLVDFLRSLEGGRYLPRKRVVLVDESRPDDRAEVDESTSPEPTSSPRVNGKQPRPETEEHGMAELRERALDDRERRDDREMRSEHGPSEPR